MAATMTTRATHATRLVALGGIRATGLVVAIGAAATGIAYAVVSIAGDTVISPGEGVYALDQGLISGLPLPLRALNAAAFALASFVIAGMAAIVSDLASRIRRSVRFDAAVSRATAALAIVLGFGATVGQFTRNLLVQTTLLLPDGVDPTTVARSALPIEWGWGAHTVLPNWMLLGLAIVLGVLAYVIRAGERLQRDTDGLV